MALPVSCAPRLPEIDSIQPKIGALGEPLTISGRNFGAERGESFVTIAGISPTSSAYLSWQNDRITLIAPDFAEAGLVYVHTRGRKSNGVLFSNLAALPKPADESGPGLEPVISAVTPPIGSIGSLIIITGSNFGSSRERGGVFFSWNAELPAAAPAAAKTPDFVEVSETELGYELWNDREIRLRVPDGAVSGAMEVRTPRGTSAPFFFDVTGRPGTKTFRDKRSYTISYSVSVKTGGAEPPNTLYLWMPRPVLSAAQRNIQLLSRDREPFVDNYRGTGLYKLVDMAANSETTINLSYQVDVYAVETSVRPYSVRQEDNSPIGTAYTGSGPLLPSDDIRIKSQVNALVGRERNPYSKAQRIYEWMLGERLIQETAAPADLFSALDSKQADSYTAALLYCTLLRAAGVPCLPVAGVLVNRGRQTLRHYWAEFWLDGLGWIPVDPALGAGAVPAAFNRRPDRAGFYFGSLDSQRIAFSRGVTALSQMDPRGRPVSHSRSYALQNLWEEAAGGIDSYTSLWGDITVTGMYVQ
jgi:transglutaminase-like putative cysteine protease